MALAETRAAGPIDPAALELPRGGAWITEARRAALERLRAMGLPTRRDEYWRWTDPGALIAAAAPPAEALVSDEAPVFGEVERLKVVFVDGVFSPERSDPLAGEGLEITRLAEAAEADLHWAQGLYGALEAAAHEPVARPLAALNTATARDGVLIRVTGRPSRPISLIYLHERADADVVLHHAVRLEPGAELTLLENGPGGARLSTVLEAEIGEGARLHHVRAQGRDHERRAITHAFARLGPRAEFRSATLTVNGALIRNENLVWLEGEEGVAHLAGAVLGDGREHPFHQDDTVLVVHGAERCESRQVFKKVLKNGATGVFQGKILVRPGAQKTDGYQISQGLMLDEDARFLAKPELEIWADDVACSHGSTCGGPDEEALFYLRSRGVPRTEAEDMIVLAFLEEALAEIADARLADDLRGRLAAWLARHRSA